MIKWKIRVLYAGKNALNIESMNSLPLNWFKSQAISKWSELVSTVIKQVNSMYSWYNLRKITLCLNGILPPKP